LLTREELRLLAILKLIIASFAKISLLRSIVLISETESETDEFTQKKLQGKLQQQRNKYNNARCSSATGKSLCV
jgi:hypothetical protein